MILSCVSKAHAHALTHFLSSVSRCGYITLPRSSCTNWKSLLKGMGIKCVCVSVKVGFSLVYIYIVYGSIVYYGETSEHSCQPPGVILYHDANILASKIIWTWSILTHHVFYAFSHVFFSSRFLTTGGGGMMGASNSAGTYF